MPAGRPKKQFEAELTVTVCRERDEAAEERWYKAAALLMDPKWDEEEQQSAVSGQPAIVDPLEDRLKMACGVGPWVHRFQDSTGAIIFHERD